MTLYCHLLPPIIWVSTEMNQQHVHLFHWLLTSFEFCWYATKIIKAIFLSSCQLIRQQATDPIQKAKLKKKKIRNRGNRNTR